MSDSATVESMLSADEKFLLFIAIAYLIVASIVACGMMRRAERLLRTVRDSVSPDLWQDLGAPDSVRVALNDPKGRWVKFIRGGEFRMRFPPRAIDAVEAYRRSTNLRLIGLSVTGAMILYRFWPLLKPEFL